MTSQKQWGFTIIELMLFLGITGALFAGLLVGVNTNINQQRYKESVVSYQGLLEQQYSRVYNPQNSRQGNETCTAEGGVESVTDSGQARGTSGCVLLGRYVQIKNDGMKIETGDVIGVEPAAASNGISDVDAIAAYAPRKSPINIQEYDVEWQSSLYSASQATSSASFLIIRSPVSGLVRAFGQDEPLPTVLSDMITVGAAGSSIKACVRNAASIGLPTQSVTVNAKIASPSGIQVNGGDTTC
ncbi:hypothetical protein A2707_05165 [Candidatus Saccharibacteria bacterium RIFCSPHIGHO2_01_FULL_45_15]|nr:MAG: hypothetical protein A2707_05165 [Candidatus Saccharibacteria bacterium RIFCSPHIGHO2_01_FULL_45_15]OGL32645.1 MAG: hypothetical protein A3E76_04800 [Candidatus Saccharibacteria bacterium RIFCSPHIGHO2_12_FULL_44_22]